MRNPRIKMQRGQMKKLKEVIKLVFLDGKTTGSKARSAKKYFAEVILNSI